LSILHAENHKNKKGKGQLSVRHCNKNATNMMAEKQPDKCTHTLGTYQPLETAAECMSSKTEADLRQHRLRTCGFGLT
jgi:hypothetical protein